MTKKKTVTTTPTTRVRKPDNRQPTARFVPDECRVLLKAFREARNGGRLAFEKFDYLNKIESKLLHHIRKDEARKKAQEEASSGDLQNSSGQIESGGDIQEGPGGQQVGSESRNGGSEDPGLCIRSSVTAGGEAAG